MANNDHTRMEEAILARIRGNAVRVRPRFYFTLQFAALVVVAFFTLLFSVLIFNFIFFTVRINGNGALLDFGPRGFWTYLILFPWLFVALDAACIVLLEALLRKFRFGYRSPILYLLIALISISLVAGFALDRGTGFNDHLLNRAHHRGLPPPFLGLYGRAPHPPGPGSGLCKCVITAIDGTTLSATDLDSDTGRPVTIIARPDDPILAELKVGDVVFVAGDESSSTIHAFGIRKNPPRGPDEFREFRTNATATDAH